MKTQKEYYLTNKKIRLRTVIGFSLLITFLSLCLIGWGILHDQPRDNRALVPIRKTLEYNSVIFGSFFSNNRLSAEYSKEDVVPFVRTNGKYGLRSPLDTSAWRLHVIRKNGDTLSLSMQALQSLPKTEIIFDFKCIEGWSQVTHWGGVRFSDFVQALHLEAEAGQKYVGLSTPDNEYYVGIDRKSMMHPQTLLCYEMNGKALPPNNGFPLRLIIPVKYGVKHLKRLGRITFSEERPPDYWHERGYDYDCGL